jgi:hypothetical protein
MHLKKRLHQVFSLYRDAARRPKDATASLCHLFALRSEALENGFQCELFFLIVFVR